LAKKGGGGEQFLSVSNLSSVYGGFKDNLTDILSTEWTIPEIHAQLNFFTIVEISKLGRSFLLDLFI